MSGDFGHCINLVTGVVMTESQVNGRDVGLPGNGNGNGGKFFSSFFTSGNVLCQAEIGDREDIIMRLLKLLAMEKGIGNVQQAFDAIMDNEKIMPSIMVPGLAVPHARLSGVDNITVAVATSRKGFSYADTVAEPVHVVVLILSPKTAPGSHLQSLSSLARIFREPEAVRVVSDLETSAEVWEFFHSGGVLLPEYLRVRDVMRPVEVVLHENDTLAKAIDLFVKYGRIDLPVIDNEKELIGVVTSYELLRVCLPDYILWMDDLSPILKFEPFAEVLRNESRTWLVDIMASDYATCEVDKPAIQVAKEFTRWRVDHAYVLEGRKLVGVVSLENFLRQILRE